MSLRLCLLTLILWPLVARQATADESLAGKACRSVHLFYPAPEGTAFYNEVRVDQSVEGSYFMVCGFRMGYFGIQELSGGKKVVLFSVWDPGSQNDPNATPEEKRVKMLHEGKGVRVKRFGGEGTGGQCFFDYDWKLGQTYRFLVTALPRPDGQRTAFSGYFYLPEKKEWKHLVTFSTLSKGKLLRGYYSFVEDFKRNGISATQPRGAHFGNGWIRKQDGNWQALTKARFTADRNPALHINSGQDDGWFFLVTGGDTKNTGTKLRDLMKLPQAERALPADLPKLP